MRTVRATFQIQAIPSTTTHKAGEPLGLVIARANLIEQFPYFGNYVILRREVTQRSQLSETFAIHLS